MKKMIFLVGIIATMGLGAFIVSCGKDDDKSNSQDEICVCGVTSNTLNALGLTCSEAKEYVKKYGCDDLFDDYFNK
jgi:hypothetical protein